MTEPIEVTPAERRPEPADAFALLDAHLRGAADEIATICSMVDIGALFAMTVGVLVDAFGEDRVRLLVDEWRAREYPGQ